MSSSPRDWLPLEIAGHASIRAALAGAAEAWSAHWFARRRLAVGAIEPSGGGALGSDYGWSWRRYGQSLAVNRPVGIAAPLAGWLLEADWPPQLESPADRLILEDLEKVLLADLCARLESALGVPAADQPAPEAAPDPLGRDGGAVVELKEAGGVLALRVAVPLAVLAGARRSTMPARRISIVPLEPRLGAVGSAKVTAEAQLGRVDLALEELQNLAPGDVLVLNNKLDGLALLAVEGTARPLAHGRVSNTEGRLSLTLEA